LSFLASCAVKKLERR